MYQAHHVLPFSAEPGALLRDHVTPTRAKRLSEPASPDPPCAWLDVRANNEGFFSPYDYPYSGGDVDVPVRTVGIFGGSAAHWFALQAGPELATALDDDRRDGERSVVLNCGIGGMKQPQTLFALDWLLVKGQRFDRVIVLDGFNEAALSLLNHREGVEPTAPSSHHLRDLLGQDLDAYEMRAGREVADGDVAQRAAAVWANATRLMQDTCRSQGIPVVHVLQPNQYFGHRSFSLRERRTAISRTTPYRSAVEAVYPLLVDHAADLAAAGYHVVDATGVLDDVKGVVYSDNCCHYNRRGNDALRELVVAEMLRAPGTAPRPRAGRPQTSPPPAPSSGVSDASDDGPPAEGDALYPMW